jgi:hypothetical protein
MYFDTCRELLGTLPEFPVDKLEKDPAFTPHARWRKGEDRHFTELAAQCTPPLKTAERIRVDVGWEIAGSNPEDLEGVECAFGISFFDTKVRNVGPCRVL